MIIPILLLGLLLRLVHINQSLWLDESIGVVAVKSLGLSELLTRFSPGNFHPPLYYILAKVWGSFLGFTEPSIRMFSVSLGLVAIYLTYLIAYQLPALQKAGQRSQLFPLLSAFLLAINPLHIYYSQEAWVYSLSTTLGAACVYLYIKLLKRPSIKYSILLALVFTLSLYTFYPLVFLVLSLTAHSISTGQARKFVFASLLVSLLLFLPWTKYFLIQLKIAANIRTELPIWYQLLGKTNFKSVALLWIKFHIGRISFYTKFGYAAYVIVVSFFSFLALIYAFSKRYKLSAIWVWIIGPLIFSLLAGIFGSGFAYFRLIFLLPAFCILLACGFQKLGTFPTVAYSLGSLTSLTIFWINPRFHRENWREAISFVEANSTANSISVFINYSQTSPYVYYSHKVPVYSSRDWMNYSSDHLWLFRYVQPIFDPSDTLQNNITKSGYRKIREKDFNGVTVWEYRK